MIIGRLQNIRGKKKKTMKKEKTELEKLSTKEIYDELRKGLSQYEQDKLNSKLKDKKKKEIIELYKKGGLSRSDTIAYETNLLLDRNRKNTSIIVDILVIYFIIGILYAIFLLIGLLNS